MADKPSATTSPSRWGPLVSFTLSLVGVALAGYLTYEHYSAGTTLSCPDTGPINCLKVTTSAYSSLLGVPVALLGLLYFAVMAAICSPPTWRSRLSRMPLLRLAGSALGVVFVLYLIWIELFKVDAICLWCTAVHAVTLLLFIQLVFAYASTPTTRVSRYEAAP